MAFPIFRSLCVLFAMVAYCAAATGQTPAPAEYLPLQVGHEWIMDVTYTAPDGTEQKAVGRRKIEAEVERDGKTYFRVLTAIEGGPMPVSYRKLTRKDETGLYSIDERDPKAGEQLEVKLPLQVGDTWERTFGNAKFKDTVLDLTVLSVGSTIYHACYHIRTKSDLAGGYTEEYWEAPGMGAVKSTISFTTGGKIDLVLREFRKSRGS